MMKDTILALLLLLSACGGESLNPGTEEPLLVDKGTLHAGEVPPPPDTDPGTDSAATDLAVTDIELPSSVAGVGESRTLTGRVAEAAYAIAVQLASEATAAYGSGYWIVPIALVAVVIGMIKARFILIKYANKAVARIQRRGHACFFGFFAPTSWLFVIVMMGGGMMLRQSALVNYAWGRVFLSTLYIAVGTALAIADRVFWIAALRLQAAPEEKPPAAE